MKNINKFVETVVIIILLGIISSPFIYIYYSHPTINFWENAFGNLLATVLALVAGIPIAFWVDRLIQRKQNEEDFLKERRRELEILTLLKEELNFSYNSLFLNGKKGNSNSLTIQPLKSDLWDAFTASEELKFIQDVKLVNRITSAYYVLNIVKNIEHQAYIALRTSAISFTIQGKTMNAAQLLIQDARGFDSLYEESTKEALKAIELRIKALKKK